MGVFSAWVVAIGLQTVRDVRNDTAPLPSEYVASGVWFGALALVDGFLSPVGSLVAWGTLAALAYQAAGRAGGLGSLLGTTTAATPTKPGKPAVVGGPGSHQQA